MRIGAAAGRWESYRKRLYRHYLSVHRGDLREARQGLHAAAPYLKKLIRRHLPGNKDIRIVDLGCGYGALLYWLREAGYRNLEGIDGSPEQVEGAHELGLDFVQQDDVMAYLANRVPASCDVVFAFDVLEHFSKDEAVEFADEVFRILAPGGLFIIHTPNGEGSLSGCVVYGDFTHELIVTRQSLGQLLRCAGFSRVSTFEDTPVVHGIVSAGRYVIWKAFRGVLRFVYAAQTGELGGEVIFTQNFLTVAYKDCDAIRPPAVIRG